jgi:hypothetical protein
MKNENKMTEKNLIPVERTREVEMVTYDCSICGGLAGDTIKEAKKHAKIPIDKPLPAGFVYFAKRILNPRCKELVYNIVLNKDIQESRDERARGGIIADGMHTKWYSDTCSDKKYNSNLTHGIEQIVAQIAGLDFQGYTFEDDCDENPIENNNPQKNINNLKNHLTKRLREKDCSVNGQKFWIETYAKGYRSHDSDLPTFPRVNSREIKQNLADCTDLSTYPRILHPEEFELVEWMWEDLKRDFAKKIELETARYKLGKEKSLRGSGGSYPIDMVRNSLSRDMESYESIKNIKLQAQP